jgi:ankyrin repeat protein
MISVLGADMNQLQHILEKVRETADFENVDLSNINAASSDGDNALHVVVRWNDLEAATVLINAGVDINKSGDLGYTPLHVACMQGNLEMVKLLIAKGADIFALSEGVPPFTSARMAGNDEICDLLKPLMQELQERDPKIRLKSRMSRLRAELAQLEAELKE